MNIVLQIGLILLALSILITIHELGHFWAARIFKMRVEVFSLFFGPKIFSIKKGDTEYRLSIIPLGGYVKISGMLDESMDKEALKEPPKDYEFRSKPRWQRLIVMLGGIIMNILLGCMIFIGYKWYTGDTVVPPAKVPNGIEVIAGSSADSLGFKTGDKLISYQGEEIKDLNEYLNVSFLVDEDKEFTVLRNGKEVSISIPDDFMSTFNFRKEGALFSLDGTPKVVVIDTNYAKAKFQKESFSEVPKDSLDNITLGAWNAGIRTGDVIVSVDSTPVSTFSEVREVCLANQGEKVQVVIQRENENGGGNSRIPMMAQVSEDGKIGIGIDTDQFVEKVKYSFGEAVPVGISYAFRRGFVETLKGLRLLVKGNANPTTSMSGPLKISKVMVTGFNREGWGFFWWLTGYLSMVLAIMNLLPIPVLDGGHVLFLLIESVIGRDLPEKFKEWAMNIGFFLIIGLMLFVIVNDIVNYNV